MMNFDELLKFSARNGELVSNQIGGLPESVLNWKESEKKWSVLEVIGHLNQVYELYFPNFEHVLGQASPLSSQKSVLRQTTWLGRLSIYSMKPKDRKIRFKMATFKFFEPVLDTTGSNQTLDTYFANKERFEGLISKSVGLDISGIKVPTALGKRVKFYIPECFEFILSHEERHLVQIDNILNKHSAS
jgi:hypothetical protein